MLTKPLLKHIQSLKIKKYRQKYAEFIIEGDKLINEAINEQVKIKSIIATPEWFTRNKHAISDSVIIEEAGQNEIHKLSSLHTPPPVIAIVAMDSNKEKHFLETDAWSIALDGINDPGNLGSIIRSADWFGVRHIYCSEDCVDVYNAKTIQASMGSLFRMCIEYVNLSDILPAIKLPKYAAALNAESLYNTDFSNKGVLVIGSESHGIQAEILNICEKHITIPGNGRAESLNASIACSIILAHIFRH